MQRSHRFLVDSYKAAIGDMKSLFSAFRSEHHTRNAVRRYVMTRSRHMQRLSPHQQRSWIRGNISLVLQEARRRQCPAVAQAALAIALEEKEWVEEVDPSWVKDALASCRSPAELKALEASLQQYAPAYLVGSGTTSSSGGAESIISILLGGSSRASRVGANDGAVRLGDDMEVSQNILSVLSDDQNQDHLAHMEHGNSSAPSEAEVARALAHVSPAAAGSSTLVNADHRALMALQRLRDRREENTIAPNQSFTRYFLRQGLVQSEGELMALCQAMRAKPQEVGFRVHLSHALGAATMRLLQGREGILPVSWLPPSMGAFVLDARSADAIHRNRPLLKALAKEGLISFQSTSSMLPVHYLDPQPGDAVLDLCAAPGSKTSLIIDCMQGGDGSGGHQHGSSGCVVANEFHEARAKDMQRRLQNASPGVAMTHMSGEDFGGAALDNYFDRVLVDAPCSGEGRLGREPMAWRLWHPAKGLEFFPRQVALLQRAVEACKPGGTIVYATCTLNPLENEAVVSATLQAFSDCVELMPPPPSPATYSDGGGDALLSTNILRSRPLKLSPGLKTWLVPSSAGGFYATAEEAARAEMRNSIIPSTVFPPAVVSTDQHQSLFNCRRILPHQNAPGSEGFFVAVLRKTAAHSRTAAKNDSLVEQQRGGGAKLGVSLDSNASSAVAGIMASSVHSTSTSTVATRGFHESALLQRGLTCLPATNHRVQQLLAPFFDGRSAAVREYVSDMQYAPVWSEDEGLRLVTEDAVSAMKLMSGVGRHHRGLLDLGAVAFTPQGNLTESGAALLRGHATSRLLRLPAHYVQLLLAGRRVDVSRDMEDAAAAARRVTSNGLVVGPADTKEHGAALWASEMLDAIGLHGGSGNAIVTAAAPPPQLGNETWEQTLLSWSFPVLVEVLSTGAAPQGGRGSSVQSARLHLLLSAPARQRCIAMIGRLQGKDKRSSTRENIAESLRDAADYTTSHTVGVRELTGAQHSIHEQTRSLFDQPESSAFASSSTHTTGGEGHQKKKVQDILEL